MSPTRRAYAVTCGVGVPVLLVAVGTAIGLLERGSLPRPIAVHWRSDVVTGTSPLPDFLLATAVEVLAPALIVLALASRMPRSARPVLVATAVGTATTLGLAAYGLMLGQRGLSDPGQAPNPFGTVLGSFLLGLIAGIAVAQGYPAGHVRERAAVPPARAQRLPAVTGSPTFTVALRPAGALLGWYAGVLVVTLLGLAAVVRDWWICVVGVVLAVGVLSMLFPVVRVDDGGLRVRGFGVVPWIGHRIGEVGFAEARQDAGRPHGLRRAGPGRWSYRVRPGGVVTVHLHDGSRVTFSCAAAATCAGALNVLVEQRALDVERRHGRLTGAV